MSEIPSRVIFNFFPPFFSRPFCVERSLVWFLSKTDEENKRLVRPQRPSLSHPILSPASVELTVGLANAPSQLAHT